MAALKRLPALARRDRRSSIHRWTKTPNRRRLKSSHQQLLAIPRSVNFHWIHIFHPLADAVAKNISNLTHHEPVLKNAEVNPVHCVPQMGLTYDTTTKRFKQSSNQTFTGEVLAAAKVGQVLGLPTPVRLLPRHSGALKRLELKYFPVHILLDTNCNVLGIVIGAEKQKIGHLVDETRKREAE